MVPTPFSEKRGCLIVGTTNFPALNSERFDYPIRSVSTQTTVSVNQLRLGIMKSSN